MGSRDPAAGPAETKRWRLRLSEDVRAAGAVAASASLLGSASLRVKILGAVLGLTLVAVAIIARLAEEAASRALADEHLERGRALLHVVELVFPEGTDLRGPWAEGRLAAIAQGQGDIRRLAILTPELDHWRVEASSREEDLFKTLELRVRPGGLTGPMVLPSHEDHGETDYFLAPLRRLGVPGAVVLIEIDAGPVHRALGDVLGRAWQVGLVGVLILAAVLFWQMDLLFVRPHLNMAMAAFAQYVPPEVAQELARNPSAVKLGGERRPLTVLFTDLKDFTTFSESVEPEVLTRVVTEYLNVMTGVVFDHQGTLDKYIGDSVMAFWNAPKTQPDHARRACLAALRMQRELERLSDAWERDGLPRQYMRIGINTGPASVGNMGSALRIAYTAIGDTVNLAARLEALNKHYGTWICLSESTLAEAGPGFRARYLDLVVVKGASHPLAVYELVGLESELPEARRQLLERYEAGIELYRAHRFAEAAAQFRAALELDLSDGPSRVYLHRCEQHQEARTADGRDGAQVMPHT